MYCGRKRTLRDLEIDHKVPPKRGGKEDDPRNMQVLCHSCNKRKGDQTDEEFRTRYRKLLGRRKSPPYPSIRQDEFDMLTASTKRQSTDNSNRRDEKPKLATGRTQNITFERIKGFFQDAVIVRWENPTGDGPVLETQMQNRLYAPTGEWSKTKEMPGTRTELRLDEAPKNRPFGVRIRHRFEAGWTAWSPETPDTSIQ